MGKKVKINNRRSYYYSITKSRWVGLQKSYVINGVGHEKVLCLLTRWVGGSENGLKYAYVIFEWSLRMKKDSIMILKRIRKNQRGTRNQDTGIKSV